MSINKKLLRIIIILSIVLTGVLSMLHTSSTDCSNNPLLGCNSFPGIVSWGIPKTFYIMYSGGGTAFFSPFALFENFIVVAFIVALSVITVAKVNLLSHKLATKQPAEKTE